MKPIDALLVAASAAAVASGCATGPNARAQIPDVSMGCVAHLQDVAPTPLAYPTQPPERIRHVQFASLARCVKPVEGEATPVALYRLEGVALPAQVDVSVLLSTGGTLAAVVELLDGEFRPVRRYGFDAFTRRGSEYSLVAFLNPSMGDVAYVSVAPDRGQAGKADVAIGAGAMTMAVPAGPVMFMYTSGTEANVSRPFVEGGQIRITVQPQQAELLPGTAAN